MVFACAQEKTNSKWKWTGLAGRTLWDWLQLLVMPATLALGGFWFSQIRKSNEQKAADDNQKEAALQAFIANMSELLLEKQLGESQPEDEVRKIARVRTLTVLRRLDARRKRIALQFLYEADLIDKDKRIIDLLGADLSRADLSRADLSRADLSRADLSRADLSQANLIDSVFREANVIGADLNKANLSGADLREANLRSANLREADLREADLREADLRRANFNEADLSQAVLTGTDLSQADLRGTTVTPEQLEKAKSLKGATIRVRSTHSGRLPNFNPGELPYFN